MDSVQNSPSPSKHQHLKPKPDKEPPLKNERKTKEKHKPIFLVTVGENKKENFCKLNSRTHKKKVMHMNKMIPLRDIGLIEHM